MTWLGVIDTAITTLIPVGSMLIANAMNTNGLALNRFRSDVLAHVGEIETGWPWAPTPGRVSPNTFRSPSRPALFPPSIPCGR